MGITPLDSRLNMRLASVGSNVRKWIRSYSTKHVFPQAPSPTNTSFLRSVDEAEMFFDGGFSIEGFVFASLDRFSPLELLLSKSWVNDLLFALIDDSWGAGLG